MNTAIFWILKFLQFVPSIAAEIQSVHSTKSLDDKLQIGAGALSTATTIASSLLEGDNSRLAGIAGNAAQSVLAATIAAIHSAHEPAPANI